MTNSKIEVKHVVELDKLPAHITLRTGDELFLSLPPDFELLSVEVPRFHFSSNGASTQFLESCKYSAKALRAGFGKIVVRIAETLSRKEQQVSLNYSIAV